MTVERQEFAAARAHMPVMVVEVRERLCASPPRIIVDATLGQGGHAEQLLDAAPEARLFGIDCDDSALSTARERLARFGARVTLCHGNFAEIAGLAREHLPDGADAILADLGMSSFALDNPERGFSFRLDGPLDMRMDQSAGLRAYDIVNEEPEADLANLLHQLGEERAARKVARAIVEARRRRPIATTRELCALVEGVLGTHRRGGVHPATRTFQALRIAVNRELESLAAFLRDAPGLLRPSGCLVVIAYHSLEDRAVKERFRELERSGAFELVTRKAQRPAEGEVARNPRARSARLRTLARVAP